VTTLFRIAPPMAALVYPILIWSGPAVFPALLALALAVPVLAIVVFDHAALQNYPRARAIAVTVAGAPPLYSWLGGLLDFQRLLPFGSLGIWIPLWSALAWLAYTERPRFMVNPAARPARLAFAHGLSATVIVTFAIAHLTNHLFGLSSGARHIEVMNWLRGVYRQPIVEAVLLGSVAFQFVSGLRLVWAKLARRGDWFDSLQIASGLYLALFFLSHLTAVLRARHLRHVDTNWVWLTADSMLHDPWSARLAPYYFLGVIALGVHAGAGLRFVLIAHGQSLQLANRVFFVVTAATTAVSVLILTALLR
jgi:succinate dehydrogenase/fumarate reductase cytochrome b subunit